MLAASALGTPGNILFWQSRLSAVLAGTMRLGQATVTYDSEAEPCEVLPWEHITGDEWRCAQQLQVSVADVCIPAMSLHV